jgi:hypothetical protein
MTDLSARLEAAALSLTGPGPIKERLLDAYSQHLGDIASTDVPGELGEKFAAMTLALHQAKVLPGDDVVRASVRKLSNDQACRYAELVIKLYGMFAGMKYQVASNRGAARHSVPLAKLLSAEAIDTA